MRETSGEPAKHITPRDPRAANAGTPAALALFNSNDALIVHVWFPRDPRTSQIEALPESFNLGVANSPVEVAGPMTNSAASPESISPAPWLWIPGSRPMAAPRNDA
jgi:hypothetical protein